MVFVLLEMMRCIYLTRSILGNMLAKIGGTNMSVGRMQKVGGQGGGREMGGLFLENNRKQLSTSLLYVGFLILSWIRITD